MAHLLIRTLVTISALSLASCATAPDPAEVCTSEWISERSSKAMSKISSKSSSSLKALKKASESWVQGQKPSFFTLLALNNATKSLRNELTNGQGIKDLRVLSKTCNDPKLISDSLGNFMREQGLSERMIGFVEKLEVYQNAINPDGPPEQPQP